MNTSKKTYQCIVTFFLADVAPEDSADTKTKLDKAFVTELKRRATVNVLTNATLLTHGHNQPVDGGVSRNFFNLSDPGSKAITDMLLNDGEEELKLITGSRLPAKCGDVRKHFVYFTLCNFIEVSNLYCY